MKITLVRHGQTDFNSENRIQGQINNSLNDYGRSQCKRLRGELLDKDFDICYVSPLFRAVETSFILIGDRVPTVTDKRLIERNMGELEGMSREEYDSKRYWDYNLNCGDMGVEKIQDLFARAKDFLNYLFDSCSGMNVLVVSHGAMIRAMHYLLKGVDLANTNLNLDIPNCYMEEFLMNKKI